MHKRCSIQRRMASNGWVGGFRESCRAIRRQESECRGGMQLFRLLFARTCDLCTALGLHELLASSAMQVTWNSITNLNLAPVTLHFFQNSYVDFHLLSEFVLHETRNCFGNLSQTLFSNCRAWLAIHVITAAKFLNWIGTRIFLGLRQDNIYNDVAA